MTRVPPIGNRRWPPASRCAPITAASAAQRTPMFASGSRLAVYWIVTCGIAAAPSSIDIHHRDRAADREDRNRRIEAHRAAAARCRRRGDEGADLEAALAGLAI